MFDEAGESTYCHGCGDLLIRRNWFVLSDWRLDEHGRCARCGTRCPGVFEASPGRWGARRLPVVLREFAA